jgi:Leu/Phe-tRNA-protein transferase
MWQKKNLTKNVNHEALLAYAHGIFPLAKSAKAFCNFAYATSRDVAFTHELALIVSCDGG